MNITENMKPNHMDLARAREFGQKVAHAKMRAREAMTTKFDKANRVWFSIEDCDALMDEMRKAKIEEIWKIKSFCLGGSK